MTVPVHNQQFTGGSSSTIFPSVTPTPGNVMVLACWSRDHNSGPLSLTGWTAISPGNMSVPENNGGFLRDLIVFWRVAQTGDTSWFIDAGNSLFHYSEWDVAGGVLEASNTHTTSASGSLVDSYDCGGSVTVSGPAIIIGIQSVISQLCSYVPDSPAIEVYEDPKLWLGYRSVAGAGTYSVTGTSTISAGFSQPHMGATLAFLLALPPVADFTSDTTTINEGGTIAFTDLSTNSPTSWAWDFGDGGTSTSQNPSHVYANAGNYSVTLTATNADGSDAETKSAYINVLADVGYIPPEPGRAILEIKATPPGADRWDVALWDTGRWSATAWQDVTPMAVEVSVLWGSGRPEFGILSTPDAASWAISFYDPNRILDPANPDSPYYRDLQPLLPVRLRHNETVIKQGFLESGSHRFSDDTGYWRVMDIQAVLANVPVPADTTLSNTLFQRARDAISAAALSITVAPDPPGGDPALAPWVSEDRTAWEWISDAAQQVLWVPFVRNDNTLSFRSYLQPLSRGRSIGSPNLEDLQSITAHNGLFSIVGALELVSEGTDINRRELTPKPRYGAREYLRTDPTPNSGDWAQAVLNDRAVPALRWEPGRVIPFTASETQYFATLEALEQVSVNYPEADPAVLFDGIIVGGSIHVIGKQDASAIWDFQFNVAQIPLQPLTDDDDVSSYLTNDDDATDILFPDV